MVNVAGVVLVPSLAEIVTLAVPFTPTAGVTVPTQLGGVPLKVMLPAGNRVGLSDVTVTALAQVSAVSLSVIWKVNV
jgi:hypothetical protein